MSLKLVGRILRHIDGRLLPDPVFKTIFQSDGENSAQQHIEIDGIEALVFIALLQFICKDSLPKDTGANRASTVMAQHLLVAAYRYGLESMKLVCKERLCKELDVEIVATTLALTEQQNCCRLELCALNLLP